MALKMGDLISLGTLAWTVYKSAKEAPESFSNIHDEVLSLYVLIKEAEETIFEAPLPPEKQARLATVQRGCMIVLTDLGKLMKKYDSLGTKSKRTWDRMRWGHEDINNIRARLTTNVTLLAAFISTSQARVEQKLDKFLQEIQEGKREGSVISVRTIDSLTKDERAGWRAIRKELEDSGISLAAWEANREFIMNWFIRMADAGVFGEEANFIENGDNRPILPTFKSFSIQPHPTTNEFQMAGTYHPRPNLLMTTSDTKTVASSLKVLEETSKPLPILPDPIAQMLEMIDTAYPSLDTLGASIDLKDAKSSLRVEYLKEISLSYVLALHARHEILGACLISLNHKLIDTVAISHIFRNVPTYRKRLEIAATVPVDTLFLAFWVFMDVKWNQMLSATVKESERRCLISHFVGLFIINAELHEDFRSCETLLWQLMVNYKELFQDERWVLEHVVPDNLEPAL